MQYLVVKDEEGWLVRDDEQILVVADTRADALEIAKILVAAVKAVGGRSDIALQDERGALHPYDLNGF